jgi:hypothetical protein
MNNIKLNIKIWFKGYDWTIWYGCHDFKIEEGLITFWNLDNDGNKSEKIVPLTEIYKIYKTHITEKED